MTPTIEEVVQQIDDWQGKAVRIMPLSGGLTNTNYRVEVDGQFYFVRIPGVKTDLLAIDRNNEYHNTCAAAEAGVGARVLYHLPEHSVMVLEFIQGKTMSIQSLNEAGMPARIAQSLKKLHAGPRFYSDFNMFRLTEFYIEICRQYEVRIPEDFLERMPAVQKIEAAMLVSPMPVSYTHLTLPTICSV